MEEFNSKSIATLTLGILSIVIPYLGLVLGIIGYIFSSKALSEINNSNQRGRGFALSGRICNIVGIFLQLIFLFIVFLGYSALFW